MSSSEEESIGKMCTMSKVSFFECPNSNLDFLHSTNDGASAMDYTKFGNVDDNGKHGRIFPDPERTLLPQGTEAFHAVFDQYCKEKIFWPIVPVLIKPYAESLESPEWYVSTRSEVLGKTLDELAATTSEAAETSWRQCESGLDGLARLLDANISPDVKEKEAVLKKSQVMGEKRSFADIQILSILWFIFRFSEGMGWERLKDRNEGRWSSLVDAWRDYLPPF